MPLPKRALSRFAFANLLWKQSPKKVFFTSAIQKNVSSIFRCLFLIEMDVGEKLEAEDGGIMKHHLFATVVRQ